MREEPRLGPLEGKEEKEKRKGAVASRGKKRGKGEWVSRLTVNDEKRY